MKLYELTVLFEKLKELLNKKNEIEALLEKDFLLQNRELASVSSIAASSTSSTPSSSSSSSFLKPQKLNLDNMLPTKIAKIFKKLKKNHEILSKVYSEIEQIIDKAKQEKKDEKDEVDYELSDKFIKAYYLLPMNYDDLLMEKEIAIRDAKYPNELCIDEKNQRFVFSDEDFSPKFIEFFEKDIQLILEIFSQNFNEEEMNKNLKLNSQDVLEKSSINHGFYPDAYQAFFENQTTFYMSRTPKREFVEKKVDDFVNEYIQSSKLPETIKPNLKGVLTTLMYQSGLPYLGSKISMGFITFNYPGYDDNKAGNTLISGGSDTNFHVSFDEKFKLKIKFFCEEKTQNIMIGKKVDFPFVRKMTVTIGVKVDKDNVPSFVLEDFKFSYVSSMDQSAEPGFKSVFLKEAFDESKKIPDNHVDLFRGFIEYLAKFCAYNSSEEMYLRLGKAKNMSESEKISRIMANFHPDFLDDLKKKPDQGKGLSAEEVNFLKKVYGLFYENKTSKEKLSEMICQFVSKKISSLSDDDKLRYLYLLKMAIGLGGNQLKAVQETSRDLVNSLKKNKAYLFVAVKSDMAILNAYKEEMKSLLFKPPVFSKEEHIVIMCSLEKEHLAMIIKTPSLLKFYDDSRYVLFVEGLSPENKIQFLIEYVIKNDQKYFDYLSQSCFPTDIDRHEVGEKLKKNLLPDVHAALGKLIMESSLEKFNALKPHLSSLLNDYAVSWPRTLKSIHQRVAMLADQNTALEKFGDIFIAAVFNDVRIYVEKKKTLKSLLVAQEIIATLHEVISKIPNKDDADQWNLSLGNIQVLIDKKLREIENIKAKQQGDEKEKGAEFSGKKSDLAEKLTRADEKSESILTTLAVRSDSEKEKPEVDYQKVSSPVLPVVFHSTNDSADKLPSSVSSISDAEKPKNS